MNGQEYVEQVYQQLEKRNAGETEFLDAVKEVFQSLALVFDKNPQYIKGGILERISEPERVISFRVPWVDDQGKFM